MTAPARWLRVAAEGRSGPFLVALVLASLLTRWPSLVVDVLDKDEAAHLVGSQVWLDGGRLYVDFVDNKPPLLYAYYALAQLGLGRGLFAVHLFTLLVWVPLIGLALAAFGGARAGAAAAFGFVVFSAAFLHHDVLAANAELVMLAPLTWALVLVRDAGRAERASCALFAGLLVGVAALCKPQAAAWLPAPALALATSLGPGAVRRGARSLVRLVAGFALPVVATWAWFAAHGTASSLVFWTLVYNFGYVRNPIPLSEAAGRAATALAPFVLATAWLWWGAWRSRRQHGSVYRNHLLAWLLVLSLPAVAAGLRFFPHYLVQLYPVLALAAAPWLARAVARPWNGVGRWLVATSLVLVVGFAVSTLWLYRIRPGVYEETRPVFERMAARLRADACFDGASLWVWGFAPQFHVASGLPPGTRFVVPMAGLTPYVPGNLASARRLAPGSGVDPRLWEMLADDLEQRRPTYVLDTAPSGLHRWQSFPVEDFPRLAEALRDRYERIASVDRVDVWRLAGCASRAGR